MSTQATIEGLQSVVVGSTVTGLADNAIARILGVGTRRFLGWASIFADLQTGSEFVQNPLRLYPIATDLERGAPNATTLLFPVIRQWTAPRNAQGATVGAFPVVDFRASPFSRLYWHDDWAVWLEIEFQNQPVRKVVLLQPDEVGRYLSTDKSHALMLSSQFDLSVETLLSGCVGESGCGVAVTLAAGEPEKVGVYRAYFELRLE